MDVKVYFEIRDNLPVDWRKLQFRDDDGKRVLAYHKRENGVSRYNSTDYFMPTTEQLSAIEQLEPGEHLTFVYVYTNYHKNKPPMDYFHLGGLYKVIRDKDQAVLYLNEFVDDVLKNGINFIVPE